MKIMKHALKYIVLFSVLAVSGIVFAEDTVGTMVAVRGKVLIDRDKRMFEAKLKDDILIKDTVSTLEASRAKMLFVDDSVLTLGEKSKAVIKELVYSKDKRGKSIFNLVEGKMRSIVGKSDFEVHTPTSVAAARGTVIFFETGIKDGKKFTIIICIEGIVTGKSSDEKITGSFTLKPGMMITIFEGEPIPDPIIAPVDVINRFLMDTDISHELSVPGPAEIIVSPGGLIIEQMGITPPLDQQPGTPDKTPVDINVIFPDK